ncbi:MAG TPA: acetyl-CoA carboxylase carboxyltransferase subunit alpha [Ktedonobacterales bacterium]|nr:acetyl-CoA carboxylase carboxyltransferase subunit alpha [Ktedonobacterales bacterium]
MAYDLDFERPLAEIERRIAALQRKGERLKADERTQIRALERELRQQTSEIYGALTSWQRVQVARHKDRPHTGDYIKLICDDFFELRGDRRFGDDRAILGGMASIDGKTLMILGHQKGNDTRERQESNFGMPHAEGYRKALRIMKQGERFRAPVVTLIDTAGAALDVDAEKRGIAQSIAENLFEMSVLRTPILSIVIGEGGSGGALGISVADRILMMENTIYTVASPEAAASIMWRDNAFASTAAEAMKITAPELKRLGLVEDIIAEPVGGAHHDRQGAAKAVKDAILTILPQLERRSIEDLLERRYQRFRAIGTIAFEPVGAASN